MATGRIGVTPNLRTRWSKAPAGGTTSLSGLDDNSVSLVYDAGFEAVYRNGVLLSRGNDYTATNGTTITLVDATIAGDIIEVFANQAIPLTSTYTQAVADAKFINNSLVDAKGDILTATAADTVTRLAAGTNNQVLMADSSQATGLKYANEATATLTAKGDILSATAANTLSRLAVGSNDQVLTADSSTATGLKWATPSAGGMTLISTTTLSGASITLSSIPSTYNHLQLVIRNYIPATDGRSLYMRYNSDSNTRYFFTSMAGATATTETFAQNFLQISGGNDNAVSQSLIVVNIYDYTNTATWKLSDNVSIINDATTTTSLRCYAGAQAYNQTSAISSITLLADTGNLTSGTVLLYGVK